MLANLIQLRDQLVEIIWLECMNDFQRGYRCAAMRTLAALNHEIVELIYEQGLEAQYAMPKVRREDEGLDDKRPEAQKNMQVLSL